MNLGIDTTTTAGTTLFTANFPYPNYECTVNFKCAANSSISSNIIASSFDPSNTWP